MRNSERLPRGWTLSTLGEVTDSSVDQGGPEGPQFRYVDISSIDNKAKRITEPKSIASNDAPSRARQRLRSGDVVVSMTRPNLNAIALVPPELEPSVGSTGFHVLRARTIESRWIYYAVQSAAFVETMSSLVQGALYPAVRPKDVRAFSIPVPPRDQQVKIIEEIEKQFTRLDAGIEALKRLQAHLQRYRASLLQSAFRAGEERLRVGWRMVQLGSLISEGPHNGLYLPQSRYGSGTPILRIDDYQDFWSRSSPDLRCVEATSEERTTYALAPGDLVINRVNSPSHLGKVLCIAQRHTPALFESNMMRFRIRREVQPTYLALYLRSPAGRAALLKNAKWAVNQASINQRDVAATDVLLPPDGESQDQIVSQVTASLEEIERENGVAARSLAKADRLRSAVLGAAFKGHFTDRDTPVNVV